MTVIEIMKQLLESYDKISDFVSADNIHIDFTESIDLEQKNYGLMSIGDTLISSNVWGDQKRRHNFVLYVVHPAIDDIVRLENSNFLLNLNYWLEKKKGQEITAEIDNVEKHGKVTSIGATNAMLFDIINGTVEGGFKYQIQIHVDYTLQ